MTRKVLDQAADALARNQMTPHVVATIDDAKETALSLMAPGSLVGFGGSVTLDTIGLVDAVRRGPFRIIDRYRTDLPHAVISQMQREACLSDVFLTSTNAITLSGELVNVDGRGSRMAPVIYGPERVIIVAGRNKIVSDIPAAITRIETVAAPLNAKRLKVDTPCVVSGHCMHCLSPQRICCSTVILSFQRFPGRIHVILVDQDLGY